MVRARRAARVVEPALGRTHRADLGRGRRDARARGIRTRPRLASPRRVGGGDRAAGRAVAGQGARPSKLRAARDAHDRVGRRARLGGSWSRRRVVLGDGADAGRGLCRSLHCLARVVGAAGARVRRCRGCVTRRRPRGGGSSADRGPHVPRHGDDGAHGRADVRVGATQGVDRLGHRDSERLRLRGRACPPARARSRSGRGGCSRRARGGTGGTRPPRRHRAVASRGRGPRPGPAERPARIGRVDGDQLHGCPAGRGLE